MYTVQIKQSLHNYSLYKWRYQKPNLLQKSLKSSKGHKHSCNSSRVAGVHRLMAPIAYQPVWSPLYPIKNKKWTYSESPAPDADPLDVPQALASGQLQQNVCVTVRRQNRGVPGMETPRWFNTILFVMIKKVSEMIVKRKENFTLGGKDRSDLR